MHHLRRGILRAPTPRPSPPQDSRDTDRCRRRSTTRACRRPRLSPRSPTVPQIEVATAGQTDVSTLIRYFTKDIGDEQEFVAATNAADWQPLAAADGERRRTTGRAPP